jgi:hypothetical protein
VYFRRKGGGGEGRTICNALDRLFHCNCRAR